MYKVDKYIIEDYKKNREYYHHQKKQGRPPKWKEEVDKQNQGIKRKDGKFYISFN